MFCSVFCYVFCDVFCHVFCGVFCGAFCHVFCHVFLLRAFQQRRPARGSSSKRGVCAAKKTFETGTPRGHASIDGPSQCEQHTLARYVPAVILASSRDMPPDSYAKSNSANGAGAYMHTCAHQVATWAQVTLAQTTLGQAIFGGGCLQML